MKRAALALAALSVATVALAQQTPSQTPAKPTARSASEERTTSPTQLSKADKATVTAGCLRQVQADNPHVAAKDIKTYCDEALQSYLARR